MAGMKAVLALGLLLAGGYRHGRANWGLLRLCGMSTRPLRRAAVLWPGRGRDQRDKQAPRAARGAIRTLGHAHDRKLSNALIAPVPGACLGLGARLHWSMPRCGGRTQLHAGATG